MPTRTRQRTIAGAAMLALVLALLGAACGPSASHDDGWRRTADGWQRLEPSTPAASFRCDVHPAVLVLVQVAAAWAAMRAFPRPGQTRLSWLDDDWRDFFRRSFRASAFGS